MSDKLSITKITSSLNSYKSLLSLDHFFVCPSITPYHIISIGKNPNNLSKFSNTKITEINPNIK